MQTALQKCKVCKVSEKDRPVRKCWLFEHVPRNMAWFCVFLISITNSKFALCQWKFQVSEEKPDSKRSWSLNIFEHKAARIYIHVYNDPQVIGSITITCILHAEVSLTKNLKPKVTLETASLIIPQS